jgi:hypothetical protein
MHIGEIQLLRARERAVLKSNNSFEQLYYAIKRHQQAPSEPQDDVRVHKFED